MYDDAIHAAGIITGIGRVSGRECVIVVQRLRPSRAAPIIPMTVKKHLRAQEIARENRLPCIYLVDSGGANLPHQAEVFPDREHFGRIFYNQATLSAAGIPQIAVVMGSCTAGGAYVPAMSDETIIVQRAGHDLSRRPAAGEGRDRRGGDGRGTRRRRCACAPLRRRRSLWPRTTTTRSRSARRIVANLNTRPARRHRAAPSRASRPTTPPSSTASCRPTCSKQYDVREVIARLVDGSEFDEFKALYGTTLVTGFAHIRGIPVGILANNGILFSESALKAAHFIELCCQRRIPLLFLQNIVGFMVGREVRGAAASPRTAPRW